MNVGVHVHTLGACGEYMCMHAKCMWIVHMHACKVHVECTYACIRMCKVHVY